MWVCVGMPSVEEVEFQASSTRPGGAGPAKCDQCTGAGVRSHTSHAPGPAYAARESETSQGDDVVLASRLASAADGVRDARTLEAPRGAGVRSHTPCAPGPAYPALESGGGTMCRLTLYT